MVRAIGYALLALGILGALNAIVAGPRAFSAGPTAVAVSVIAGTVCVACGVWILVSVRRRH